MYGTTKQRCNTSARFTYPLQLGMMEIRRIHITKTGDPVYLPFQELYLSAFPLCERRNPEHIPALFDEDNYHLEAWVSTGLLLGFIEWWDDESFRYIEHYAIHPDHRSSGFGSRFLSEWMSDNAKTIILEIEPVVDKLTEKRLRFYQRLSFVENKHIHHLQPPYHKHTPPVPYEILSFPGLLSEEIYLRFQELQKKTCIKTKR